MFRGLGISCLLLVFFVGCVVVWVVVVVVWVVSVDSLFLIRVSLFLGSLVFGCRIFAGFIYGGCFSSLLFCISDVGQCGGFVTQ